MEQCYDSTKYGSFRVVTSKLKVRAARFGTQSSSPYQQHIIAIANIVVNRILRKRH
jgi:hypothetical protein